MVDEMVKWWQPRHPLGEAPFSLSLREYGFLINREPGGVGVQVEDCQHLTVLDGADWSLGFSPVLDVLPYLIRLGRDVTIPAGAQFPFTLCLEHPIELVAENWGGQRIPLHRFGGPSFRAHYGPVSNGFVCLHVPASPVVPEDSVPAGRFVLPLNVSNRSTETVKLGRVVLFTDSLKLYEQGDGLTSNSVEFVITGQTEANIKYGPAPAGSAGPIWESPQAHVHGLSRMLARIQKSGRGLEYGF